jgi:signal transduction histidine kinase
VRGKARGMGTSRGIARIVVAGATVAAVVRVFDELRRVRRLATAQTSLAGELDLGRIARELAAAAHALVRADAVEVVAERADGELHTSARTGHRCGTPTTLRNGTDIIHVYRHRHLNRGEVADLESLLAAAAQAGRSARLYELTETLRAEAIERERERELLSERLLGTEEEERRRLAIALHDGPQQSTVGVALMLDAAVDAQRAGDLDEAERILLATRDRAREIVQNLRGLGFMLEPITLRDQGFCAAFSELAAGVGDWHELTIEVDAAAIDELEPVVQVHLYRIAQEALANAVKHARATTVRAEARRHADGSLTLCISDDGCGSEPEQLDRRGLHRGMDAMRERAFGAGGELVVASIAGQGTRVEVVLRTPTIAQQAA